MSPPLRRSRRATAPKQTSDFNVGDIVEILRGENTLEGRLAYRLSEGIVPNPLWIVTFDEQGRDEEVYEKAFGKIIKAIEEDLPAPPPPKRARTDDASVDGEMSAVIKKSASPSSDEGNLQRKTVHFSDNTGHSDESSQGGNPKDKSARERRSMRRQQKIDDPIGGVDALVDPANKKRRVPPSPHSSKNSKARDGSSEEVVKVKLLTGTLYLYRGPHRRAEFVRRF